MFSACTTDQLGQTSRTRPAVAQDDDLFRLGDEPSERIPGELGDGLFETGRSAVLVSGQERYLRTVETGNVSDGVNCFLPTRRDCTIGGDHLDEHEQGLSGTEVGEDEVGKVLISLDFQADRVGDAVVPHDDLVAALAQAGRLVICGDAGDALGDSLYEAVIYVRGNVASLGADARFEPMQEADVAAVRELLARAGLDHDPKTFKRVASAKGLYHWNADANQEY